MQGQAEALAFLSTLYPEPIPGAKLAVHHKHNGRFDSEWFGTDDLESMATRATELAETTDVWFSTCARRDGIAAGRRGGVADVVAVPGLFGDVDFQSPHRESGTAYPSADDGAQVLKALTTAPLPATVVVHSGYGLQPYCLFKEPFLLESDEDRRRLAGIHKGYQRLLARKLADAGLGATDPPCNLDKVLRLPGTFNRKNGDNPVAVTVTDSRAGQPIEPSDPEALLEDMGLLKDEPVHAKASIVVSRAVLPDEDKLRYLLTDDRMLATWGRTRTDMPNASRSEFDFSLATHAGWLGWSEQEIADLLVANHRYHSDKFKSGDYYSRTVGRALARVEAEGGPYPEFKTETAGEDEQPDKPTVELHIETFGQVRHVTRPPREMIAYPFLRQRDQGMLFAWRGTGKSYLLLTLLVGVAVGRDVLEWPIREPRKVLLIDGEMDFGGLVKRIAAIAKGLGLNDDAQQLLNTNLAILSRDRMTDFGTRMPYLTEAPFRKALLEQIPEGTELVAFDNLSCLVGGEENDSTSWDIMQDLLLQLRNTGHACILVHHSGKDGDQRGTSRREDILDFSMRLKSTKDQDRTKFQVQFVKLRESHKSDATNFYTELVVQVDEYHDPVDVTWTTTTVVDEKTQQTADAWQNFTDSEGKPPTVRQLTQELSAAGHKFSRGSVQNYLKKAKENGLLSAEEVS